MSTGYALAYRLGFTPWERAGEAATQHFTALLEREESERRAPLGRALDLGCGTGAHAVELAQRGWEVTGIDAVAGAVRTAHARACEQRVDVRFVQGDVTAMTSAQVGDGIDFFLDVGCFHGLQDSQRAAVGACLTRLASPHATMLLLAFTPGRRGPLPRGADREDLALALPGWTVLDEQDADASGMPGPLKGAAPCWYRLGRT